MKTIPCKFMREPRRRSCHIRHMSNVPAPEGAYDEQLEIQMALEEADGSAPAAVDAADGINSMLKRIHYLERQRALLLARVKAGEVNAASDAVSDAEATLTVRLNTARNHLAAFQAQQAGKN